jgi:hypothetical protein
MARYEEKKTNWKILKDEIVDYEAYMNWDFEKGTKKTLLKKFHGTSKEANELIKEFEKKELDKLPETKKKQKKIKWFYIWKKIDHRNERL